MYMKKYLFFAVAVLLLAGCNKSGTDNTQKPVASWSANEKFSEMEISSDMDAKVTLSVPEGVSALTIKVTKLPVELIGVANKMIGSSSNKGTAAKSPVFDLVNDATVVSSLTGIGFLLGSPKTGTSLTFDFSNLLEELSSDSVLENGSKFVFDLALSDKAGNTLNKTVRFNWTAGPEVDLVSNNKLPYSLVRGGSEPLVVKVTAYGKIAALTLSLDDCKDEGILNYIKRRNGTTSVVIDLMNENSSSAFNLPAVKDLEGKTSAEINFTSLMQNFSYEASTTGTSMFFVLKVADELGKETEFSIGLVIPLPSAS